MKFIKIIYWVATVLMCGMFLYSAGMYFFKTEMVTGFFEYLNYPTYLVIPLAIAKVLGVIVVLWRGNKWLMEWAYAGFFFDVLLAFFAHYHAGDGLIQSAATLVAVLVSYFLGKVART